jgi:hypothetical protein
MVECLPSMCEALGLTLSTVKKKKKKGKQNCALFINITTIPISKNI